MYELDEMEKNVVEPEQPEARTRLLEEALQKCEAKFHAVANYTFDCETWVGPDGKPIWINSGVSRFTGYSVEESTAMADFPLSLCHEDDKDRIAKLYEEARQGSSGNNVEFRLRCKDGSLKWASVSWHPVYDGNGSSLGHRSSVRDITSYKLAEDMLVKYRDHLEQSVKERTAELAQLNGKLEQEIAERKRAQAVLDAKSTTPEEVNTALKVLLRQTEKDRKDLEERFVSNVKKLVLPYVEKIAMGRLDAQQSLYINIIETNLNEIVSPLLQTIRQFGLSPRETQILSLIKDGKTTKEIAETIGVAPSSIDTHRNNIRSKLKLSNKKVNLQSYLHAIK